MRHYRNLVAVIILTALQSAFGGEHLGFRVSTFAISIDNQQWKVSVAQLTGSDTALQKGVVVLASADSKIEMGGSEENDGGEWLWLVESPEGSVVVTSRTFVCMLAGTPASFAVAPLETLDLTDTDAVLTFSTKSHLRLRSFRKVAEPGATDNPDSAGCQSEKSSSN